MNVRQIQCPQCATTANVAASIVNVRCPKCGCVWNVNQPPAPATASPNRPAAGSSADDESAEEKKNANLAALGVVVGLLVVLILLGTGIGLVTMMGSGPGDQATVSDSADEEEEVEFQIEEYRVVDLHETKRKQIYDDIRSAARVTREKPILGIEGSAVRNMQEDMLQKTYERELKRFAAIHDVEMEDMLEITKEGNAKGWDPSPRSNARRNGKRLYPAEMRKKAK